MTRKDKGLMAAPEAPRYEEIIEETSPAPLRNATPLLQRLRQTEAERYAQKRRADHSQETAELLHTELLGARAELRRYRVMRERVMYELGGLSSKKFTEPIHRAYEAARLVKGDANATGRCLTCGSEDPELHYNERGLLTMQTCPDSFHDLRKDTE
jgi:hypothetical protein